MPDREFSKVEKLYHAALERPASEREAFLAEACGGDEGLLREVKSLLAHASEAKRPREGPVAHAAEQGALVHGTRLGPYEVLEPLGVGGMGEVYRARDTRLDRTVALKVLRSELASDPRLKARFEREARAVSALAHPNICTLYDIGEEDGQTFLVMEHLVGQTLAERLEKGPLPVEQALEVATQVADGLAAAHRQGIVHRDLKPGNVMLTKTGARLLDFGLARLTGHGEQPAVESLTSAPTKQAPLTGQGTILGTLPYMAPEQVEGKPADARADLWALGTILYEMVTGTRAFDASTPVSLIGAILEREPAPLRERQPLTPPSLERLVQRCLAKDPDERWDTAHDLSVRLREIAEAHTESEVRRTAPTSLRWAIPVMAVLVVVALLAGVLADRLWFRPPESARPGPVVRSTIDLTADRPLRSPWGRDHPIRTELALSPDGTLLVWTSRTGDDPTVSALHVRRLDTGEVTRIPGTDGGCQPFFSPDGLWLGFSAWDGRRSWLRKVPIDGGLPVDLAGLPGRTPMGAHWGPNGQILVGSTRGGIRSVPAEGGLLREVTTVDPAREAGHRFPSVLPGGRAVIFTAMPLAMGVKTRIEAVVLATGERKVVVEDAADAHVLPTGHLLFVRQGVLMAAPFDGERLELTASPLRVVDGVSQALGSGGDEDNSGAAQVAVTDSGALVYASGGLSPEHPIELLLMDEAGRTDPLPGFDRPLVSPQARYSPDGRQLVFVEQGRSGLLWLFDVQRQTYRALSEGGIAASPVWSPDGSRLAMGWSEAGPLQLWLVPTVRGDWERLTDRESDVWAVSWSPDGQVLAFAEGGSGSTDILVYRFEDRRSIPFLTARASGGWPEFSPDGRWLAYASNESGRYEVYVTSFPDREQTLTVSRGGGVAPAWSADGSRLFYYTPPSPEAGRSMMAVPVRQSPALSLGQPKALFRLPDGFVTLSPMRSYEPHPDGRRFVIGRYVETEPEPPITRLTLVHNWFAELEHLAPTGR